MNEFCFSCAVENLFCRHPDLNEDEIVAIQDMFEHAKKQGWLKQ
jgi:hypothetical protein